MPKVSFGDPLPIGMESLEEMFYFTVPADVTTRTVVAGLNKHLPGGVDVIACDEAPPKPLRKKSGTATYKIKIKDGFFSQGELEKFLNRHEFVFTRTNRKGKIKKIDLKHMVLNIHLVSPRELQMSLMEEEGKTIRPLEVIKEIFSLPEEQVKQLVVSKIPCKPVENPKDEN